MPKPNNIKTDLDGIDKSISFRTMTTPLNPRIIKPKGAKSKHLIFSDSVIELLESRTVIPEFDYIGYEVKTVDYVSAIFLMINPDPSNLFLVPENSLVICHH